MTIRRRDSKDGPRFDVEWRMPDRTKRSKTFISEREARVFEASLVTNSRLATSWIRGRAESPGRRCTGHGSRRAWI